MNNLCDIYGKLGISPKVLSLAKEAGNPKAVNVVLIGVMAKSTDIPYEKDIY